MADTQRTEVNGLQVATILYDFINDQVLPGTGVDADTYWKGFADVVADVLVPGGTWRLATDWADYAWHMRDVVEASPRFTNPWTGRLADAGDAHVDPEGARGGFAPRFEGRTTTRFETKGLKVERIVRDLEVKRAN